MIINKSSSSAQLLRLGNSGETLELDSDELNILLYGKLADLPRPLTALPLKRRYIARIAMIASTRVQEGFSWHNMIYELAPKNWKFILKQTKPDYLLIESCLYDSVRKWSLNCFNHNFTDKLAEIANFSRNLGIPSIFWHTLDADFLPLFKNILSAFDIVASACVKGLDYLAKNGIHAQYLPWAFSPEQFNPFTNFFKASYPSLLLFDGIAKMMRFSHVRDILEKILCPDLKIIDTSMFVPQYNLDRIRNSKLKKHVSGCISQTIVQELYKSATAYLSCGDKKHTLSPSQICRDLEAAACGCPVLHCGNEVHDLSFIKKFCEVFVSASDLKDHYSALKANPLERQINGHLCWRNAHTEHTFSLRMAEIHKWFNLDCHHFEPPLVSMVVPSMRPDNFMHVLKQYQKQNYPVKELVYVFNGPEKEKPFIAQDSSIHSLVVPTEYSTGMAMNAGIIASKGKYVFKIDDDDLYGSNYISDRMIHFREFNLDALSNSHLFFTFNNGKNAELIGSDNDKHENTIFILGNESYSMFKFNGCSIGLKRDFALTLGFQEQAYAHEDVSILLKGIHFTPLAAYALITGFNLCVMRHSLDSHTWVASHEEIKRFSKAGPLSLSKIFI